MIMVRKENLDEIDKLAEEKIEVFRSDLRPDGTSKTKNLQTIRSLSAHIANDYGDRYLFELVQNAYDALEDDELAGIIKILFAPEDGAWGTLYIANGGRPFQWENVESICSIGQSEKPAGENIGNKGLGFRSVTYIADSPNIFSLADDGKNPSDYGYCFRFAIDNDFRRWTNNPVVLEQLPRQIPPFYIPLPLEVIPSQITALMDEGFVSIISLPLRNEPSVKSVYAQMKLLKNGVSPLLLFLERLRMLDVVVLGSPELSFELTRTSSEIISNEAEGASPRLTLVELNKDKKYLIAWRYIPEAQVKVTIDESIMLKQLHPSWDKWNGNGELAVAACLDDADSINLLYTFLPMGEAAECPFNGYLHGAFYPKSDRTSLHAESPLNTMYINEALQLSVQAALAVRSLADIQDSPLTYDQCGRIITDLITWRGVASIKGYSTADYAKRMGEIFIDSGCALLERDILPVLKGKALESWGAPTSAWEWDNSIFSVLTAKRISRLANIPVLSDKLGDKRTKRFSESWKECTPKPFFTPDAKRLADVVEMVAEELLSLKADVSTWTEYYNDLLTLIKIFPQLSLPNAFISKKILLCSGNRLLAGFSPAPPGANGKKKGKKKGRPLQNIGAVVFSPSDRLMKDSPDDVTIQQLFRVPQELEQGFSFLSQKLDWYGDLDDVRQFLEKHRLVRKYDARELIANVSRIQRESADKVTRRQALIWLFTLYSARGDDLADSLLSADIYVPVGRESWTSAKRAYFSRGWNQAGKINALLEQFFENAAPISQEISSLKKLLLISPTKKPFSIAKSQEWYAFLKLIGVNIGLHPLTFDTKRINSISNISINNIGSLLGLDEETIRLWERAVGKFSIYYTGNNELDKKSKIVYWPGQRDFDSFLPETKKLNAKLLLDWISRTNFSESDLIIKYSHNYYCNAQQYRWPTPFLAFLREAEWFPVQNVVGKKKGLEFKQLKEVWLPEEIGKFRPFMPQIPPEYGIRQTLALDEVPERLKSWGDANVLNDPQCLFRQVVALGQIYKDEQVEDYCRREFINLYGATWKKIADSGVSNWGANKRPDWILVRNKGAYQSYELTAKNSPINEEENGTYKIYVPDDGKTLVCTLLEELGHNIFDFETSYPRIRGLVRDLLGPLFVATSSMPVGIFVDGTSFDTAKEARKPLVDVFPSFPALLCLAMECLTGTSAQQLPADRGEMVAKLRQIRVMQCREISFNIAGNPKPLPLSYYGVLGHLDNDVPCLILETEHTDLTWAHMRQASPALCRLLNQADLASDIKIACSAMERLGIPIDCNFSRANHLDTLCKDLGLGKSQAETALAVESGDKRRIEMLLRPLILYCVGEAAFNAFETIRERTTTIFELVNDVEKLFVNSVVQFKEIYECAKESVNYSYIQNKLKLDFEQFNKCIVTTDGEGSAITYPDEHKIIMKVFLEEQRDHLVACVQSPYIATFDSMGDVSEFVIFRSELLSLIPDPSWLLAYEEPPVEAMTARVNTWLRNNEFAQYDTFNSTLPLWTTVIKANERKLKQFIADKTKVIKAWCQVNSVAINEYWASPEPDLGRIKLALDKIGALDFRELDDALLLKWIFKAGIWPDGMPASLDLEVLGLTAENLRKTEKAASDERAAQDKAHRSVRFGSTVIDPNEADYDALSKQMQAGLPKDFLKTLLGSFADIHKIEKKPHGGGSNTGGGGKVPRLPPEKTDLIGFLGECAVYHWLKTRFPKKDIDAAWKSENRKRLCAGKGNDSLGYDFHLEYDRKNWFLEVKASLQNPMMFEMGETEVEKAKEVAISGKGEYTIIYVNSIEDPARMKILVLPNPFSEEGKKVFGPPREKFRYVFGE